MISVKWLFFSFVAFSAKYMMASKVIWCYYNSAAVKFPRKGKFDFEDNFDPFLCTHLVYGFLGIEYETGAIIHLDASIDLAENGGLSWSLEYTWATCTRDSIALVIANYLEKLKLAKEVNCDLKTILSIGGWNVPSSYFSLMVEHKDRRETFVTDALRLVEEFQFDGVDIAWFFPNGRDTVHGKDDQIRYTLLLKELYTEFNYRDLLVSAVVRPWSAQANISYNIPEITKYLDYVSLMTFDSHMNSIWYSKVTRHSAPLHKGDKSPDYISQRTVDIAVYYWIHAGCPRDKILLGIPFFGLTFILKDPNNTKPGAPSAGKGMAGPFGDLAGHIGYNELCVMFQASYWQTSFDMEAQAPYAINLHNWISYDDSKSITQKVGFAKLTDIAGVMVWTIDTDDFRGTCTADLNFGLLRNINRQLNPL